ncbi:MAG: hypothetical protein ACOX7H_01830, partial [Bacillota bacterium]
MNQYPIDYDMERMIKDAIMGEKMAVRSYEIMATLAPNMQELAQINIIRRDERKHSCLLENLYDEIIGD